MSKLQGKYFITSENEAKWAEAVYDKRGYIRFLRSKGVFELRGLDVYYFDMNGTVALTRTYVKEEDLLRMIDIDSFSPEEKDEMFYKMMLSEVEQKDLDDDTFNNVSVMQYFYTISRRTLKLAKRQAHLFKLGKEISPYLELSKRQIHSKGGRPKGSKSLPKLDDRVAYLKSSYDRIVAQCVKHNWLEEYVQLNLDLKIMNRKNSEKEFAKLRK